MYNNNESKANFRVERETFEVYHTGMYMTMVVTYTYMIMANVLAMKKEKKTSKSTYLKKGIITLLSLSLCLIYY